MYIYIYMYTYILIIYVYTYIFIPDLQYQAGTWTAQQSYLSNHIEFAVCSENASRTIYIWATNYVCHMYKNWIFESHTMREAPNAMPIWEWSALYASRTIHASQTLYESQTMYVSHELCRKLQRPCPTGSDWLCVSHELCIRHIYETRTICVRHERCMNHEQCGWHQQPYPIESGLLFMRHEPSIWVPNSICESQTIYIWTTNRACRRHQQPCPTESDSQWVRHEPSIWVTNYKYESQTLYLSHKPCRNR